MALTWESPPNPYPDIPGLVHGVVGKNPCRVQCDGCGLVAVSDSVALAVMTSGIVFNARAQPGRRMCKSCWEAVGWIEDYAGWKQL